MSLPSGIMARDEVRLKVPGKPQFVGVIRLAVAGLANQLDFPFDEAEDLKLAVTEACSFLLRSARFAIDIRVDFQVSGNSLEIEVFSEFLEPKRPAPPDLVGELGVEADPEVGMSLVEALMTTFEVQSDADTGSARVTMTRELPSMTDARDT